MKPVYIAIMFLATLSGLAQRPYLLKVTFSDIQTKDLVTTYAYLTDNDFVHGQNLIDSIEGGANRKYLAFRRQKLFYENYISLLLEALKQTPEADAVFPILSRQTQKTAEEQRRFDTEVISNDAHDAASKLARWQLQSVIYNYEKPDADKLKQRFLNRFDSSDPLLQRNKLLITISQSYLFLFSANDPEPEKRQESAINAINHLLDALAVNNEIYFEMASVLANDFMKAGFDRIALFIREARLATETACTNERDIKTIISDLDALKRMQPGNPAPDIAIGSNGLPSLYSIDSEITVIVFWADWCLHCKQIRPKYHEFLSSRKKIRVVAVVLENDKDFHDKSLHKYPDWIHLTAPEKWDDPVVSIYAVHATPTTFIMNKDKIITGKASNLKEVTSLVNMHMHQAQQII